MVMTDKTVTKKAERQGNYEMVVIISPEIADEQLETVINNMSTFITGRGGTVVEVARWGKRMLAYPIKHFNSGTYFLIRFTLKTGACKELESNLKISEQVLRHLLIKLDKMPVTKPVAPSAPPAPAAPAA
jgi:small subunit ribosomal protein S6